MCKNNYLWPIHSKEKSLKWGTSIFQAAAVDLILGQVSAVLCAVEFKKKVISIFPGTCLDHKTIFFLPCTQQVPDWRKAKNSQITSNQVKSYTLPKVIWKGCSASPFQITFTLPAQPYGGQVGLSKSPMKWPYLQIIAEPVLTPPKIHALNDSKRN